MAEIKSIRIRKILDSRGNSTVEVDVIAGNAFGRAAAPGGASKGEFEVKDYPKEGIDKGIQKFRDAAVPRIVGSDLLDQKGIDSLLHEIDGSDDFSNMGGNIAIATSLAAAKAAAKSEGVELYKMILKKKGAVLPRPLGNIIGGGKHAINSTTMQEFLALSSGKTYSESAFANVAVHKKVGEMLKKRFPDYPIGIGDEKAWVAALDDTEAVRMLEDAIKSVSQKVGIEISPGIDLAASEFNDDGNYVYKDRKLDTDGQIDFLCDMVKRFSIKYLEDPLDENDFEGFAKLTKKIGKSTMIVGDDLFVTNKERVQKGIKMGAANAVLIKPNQIGTLSDMIDTVMLAKKNDYETVISHRSGETEDATIAHLAVGLGIRYIKTGTVGGERTAKHNELIRIEEAESL